MTQMIREIANRYMDSKCSDKAFKAVRNMAESGMITNEEWLWFVSICGSMIYDYEEQRVYRMEEDGCMHFAEKFQ